MSDAGEATPNCGGMGKPNPRVSSYRTNELYRKREYLAFNSGTGDGRYSGRSTISGSNNSGGSILYKGITATVSGIGLIIGIILLVSYLMG